MIPGKLRAGVNHYRHIFAHLPAESFPDGELAHALLNLDPRATGPWEELGMAKQRKLLPAHRREAVDDSVVIRSAEALGRMIGSLHRQLDSATKRFSGPTDESVRKIALRANGNSGGNGGAEVTRAKPQRRARAANADRAATAATKNQSTGDRKSKRASKSARAMKKK